ncbi:helix-turn-helix domain-containing protein [Xylanimonas protaetiae]|nr:helix-turn-helix domain-containing protein [Xylanimonas protaetiae]
MYADLGRLIRDRREATGLDQRALAAQLGVGQQAVSGWERGQSRPRRAMLAEIARILVVEEDALVDAGEYPPTASGVRPAVRPLTRALPLEELSEERFEDFLAEVMSRLFPDGHASRFGGRGHKQHGIDILVAAGGQNLATGQCKRHREFGPAAVRHAIAEVTITAPKNYLFLSRPIATPAARSEVGNHANWEIWDGEDISRYVRNLPREQALRLVDTYFPGHRESFLGIPSPGPWLSPEDHFDATPTTIFNHEWTLAGRRRQLDELVAAAYQADATIAFVVGAGGLGKTRLLKSLADAAPAASEVRILPGDATVTASDLELLPQGGNLTVVVDDAHEVTDLTGIVAGIWRRNRSAKVVLACRPYGLRAIREGLAQHSLLPTAYTEIVLTDLEFEDATALAREALAGTAPEAVARRLAGLTADSPLVTVVGGVLIRQGQLEPGALEQDPNVRFHIMRGFSDALVKDPLAYDPPTRRAVLDALAALQPFRTNEESARESLSRIVGKPYDELHKHLRSLENAGILRRRGESLRIVPDLLGDVILTEAAFDEDNPLGTGYLARIEPLVAGVSAEHLFVNVSRVDWQVRSNRENAPSMAGSLWAAFRARVEAADIVDRRTLAEAMAKVAYFQPERTLEVTRWLIDNPTDRLDSEHAMWDGYMADDYNSVLQALPPALRFAAMNAETLPEALKQLWELAQGDERPTNQHPEHPLRILGQLAEFGVTKPIEFNDQIVDIASTWFADGQRLSPFEVLTPMLATEGHEAGFRGHTITFQPYSVNPDSVMRVRQRVIDLAFQELESFDLRRSGAAAKALKTALQYPTGLFGRTVSADERDRWTPGFVETIDRLGAAVAAGRLDPAVVVSVRDALHWHENYGDGPAHDAAQRVVVALPIDSESLLALTVHDGWGSLIRDRGDDFEAMEAKRLALLQAVVDSLTDVADAEVVELLVSRLRADREVHGSSEGDPGPLVAGLIDARPSLAHTMLEVLRSAPGQHDLDPVLPVVLSTLAAHEPAAAIGEIRDLLGSASEDRRRAAAHAIGWNRGLRELHPGELDLLLELAADPDVVVRRSVARAAQLLAPRRTAEATRLLAAIRFGDSPSVANDIFMCFRANFGISWANFSDADIERIRDDLITVPEIGGYSLASALATRSATDPAWVVRLLQERVEHAESLGSVRHYDALPYSWDAHLRVRETRDFLPSLTGILAWIADGLDSWLRRQLGADLFAAVASGYDTQVTEILGSALASGAESMTRAVSAVLGEAPRTFIWDQPDFVRAALHAANRLGDDALRDMSGALWGATISGGRTGTPGEPFPETVEQRDRSREIARDLPAGSLENRFYADMAKSADRDILRETNDDLSTDGRVW